MNCPIVSQISQKFGTIYSCLFTFSFLLVILFLVLPINAKYMLNFSSNSNL